MHIKKHTAENKTKQDKIAMNTVFSSEGKFSAKTKRDSLPSLLV